MNENMTNAYKEMISRYIDDEVTDQEREFIEKLMEEEHALYSYYKQLKKMDKILDEYPEEETSSDWEGQVRSAMARADNEEDTAMKRSVVFKTTVGGGVLVTLALALFAVFQVFSPEGVYRSVYKERFKQASDDIGDQFSPGNTNTVSIVSRLAASKPATQSQQYEPYYLQTQYAVTRNEGRVQILDNAPAPTRAVGGFQQSELLDTDKLNVQFEYWGGSKEADDTLAHLRAPSGAYNTEEYNRITENTFLAVADNPLSTFSIDVDTGSYSNIRRYLNNGQLPPVDAVRIEEMINYFSYDYPQPEGDAPFSINIDAAVCPWNSDNRLVRIGLKGKTLAQEEIPPSNLVFLIDVSGSMQSHNKLPLLKRSLKMMVKQLSDNQRVAMAVYAGSAGLVLESTPGSNKRKIMEAIDRLTAGGSTAGGAGIKLAYKVAKENFIKGGNNRVILATDGDFNVGVSSTSEMTRLIEEKREDGIFITVLGFGMGNYKDGRLEQIANKGNGTYHYIDTQNEARKVLVQELGSTLFTIAKDVKIQIEFNPNQVKAYRLIGYENRLLAKEDFNDDTKDAGELGAGHTVTALYEIVPAGSAREFGSVDPLKYQKTDVVESDEMMTVKLRYKEPDGHTSKLLSETISTDEISEQPQGDFQFASAVAEFGMLLRQSQFMGASSYEHAINAAVASKGQDTFGYRQEFIDLVRKAAANDHRPSPSDNSYTNDGPEGGLQFK